MNRIRLISRFIPILCLFLLAGVPLFLGCHDDSTTGTGTPGGGGNAAADLVITQAQAGVWHVNTMERDCASDSVSHEGGYDQTFCPGKSFFGLSDSTCVNCSVIREVNGYLIHTTQAYTDNGCTTTITASYHLRFTSAQKTSLTLDGEMNAHRTSGACGPSLDACQVLHMSASRTGPVPSGGCQ